MNHLRPIKQLPTHEVENMPPYIGNQDLWKGDKNLRDAVNREGAGSVSYTHLTLPTIYSV